jgi:glycosyltransferase involved in cell wall biosynthesis
MPYFAETVDSVLSQAHDDYEYIVVDGGSTDGTIEIIQKSKKISKWISEPDDGIADAFNKGLNFATGDYILFLNADDALANDEVINQVAEELSKNQYPDFLYGDCEVIDRASSNFLYRASIDITIKDFLRGHIFPHPSTFTKRSYFTNFGKFDTKFKIAMDYEFFLRGIKEVRFIHAPILITKVRNGGVSTVSQARVVDEIIAALKKNNYLSSPLAEPSLRCYFWIRRNTRILLSSLGIYELFWRLLRRP